MRMFSNWWRWWLCKSMNIIKDIELCTLNGCALYMNSLLRKKRKRGWRRQKQGDTSHPYSSCSDDKWLSLLPQLWKRQHRNLLQWELVHLLGQDGLLLDVRAVIPVHTGRAPLLSLSAVLCVRSEQSPASGFWPPGTVLWTSVSRHWAVTGALWKAGILRLAWGCLKRLSGKGKNTKHLISFLILKFEKKLPDYPKRIDYFNQADPEW